MRPIYSSISGRPCPTWSPISASAEGNTSSLCRLLLGNLNRRYDEFVFDKYPGEKLVVDVDGLDFLYNPKDFSDIVDRIDAKLFGLFAKA